MKRALSFALLLMVTASNAAFAKQVKFGWIQEMCDYSIRYDDKKVNAQELRDTTYLIYEAYSLLFVSSGFVSELGDIEKLDLPGLRKQCAEKREKLQGLKLLDFAGRKKDLEAMRTALLARQDAICGFEDILTRGYKTPSALREFKLAPQCEKYVTAVEDDTKVEAAWRTFVPELCANNASTEDCTKRELKKATLPDPKSHMRITLTGYAWNNCAIPAVWEGSEAQQEKLRELALAFQKHFKAKEVCEEP
jgi:hypothetical protein